MKSARFSAHPRGLPLVDFENDDFENKFDFLCVFLVLVQKIINIWRRFPLSSHAAGARSCTALRARAEIFCGSLPASASA